MAFVASAVVTVVGYPPLLIEASGPWTISSWAWRYWWVYTWFALPRHAGFAVALAWLGLVLGGRWVSDRGWLDRAGRALGWCWIVMGSLSLLSSWLLAFSS